MQVPQNLKLSLQNTEQELYCGGNVILGQTMQPSSTQGAWNEFIIPISQFGCTSPSLSQVSAFPLHSSPDHSSPDHSSIYCAG